MQWTWFQELYFFMGSLQLPYLKGTIIFDALRKFLMKKVCVKEIA